MAETVTEVLIGHVAVDSGQLMICDPGYIDSQWENEDFEDVRVYKNKHTSKTLTYGKDFKNYEEVLPESISKAVLEIFGNVIVDANLHSHY